MHFAYKDISRYSIMAETILKLFGLKTYFFTTEGIVKAVDGIDVEIKMNETLGVVGESGCGKSVMAYSILRLVKNPPGRIVEGGVFFAGNDLLALPESEMQKIRGNQISMIFQEPMTSLNPVQRIDEHLIEAIQVHEKNTKRKEALSRTETLMERLGIGSDRLISYPHQLSGGMRQRVMTGIGLVLNAELIVADEATTSLDVIVEAKLVDQLREIRDEMGITLLMITHNIALVAEMADRIAVMYAGHIIEIGDIEAVFEKPMHPYTQGLLASVPNIQFDTTEQLYKMPGEPPNLTHPPSGCRFHPRCPNAMPVCSKYEPSFAKSDDSRFIKCWLYQTQPVRS